MISSSVFCFRVKNEWWLWSWCVQNWEPHIQSHIGQQKHSWIDEFGLRNSSQAAQCLSDPTRESCNSCATSSTDIFCKAMAFLITVAIRSQFRYWGLMLAREQSTSTPALHSWCEPIVMEKLGKPIIFWLVCQVCVTALAHGTSESDSNDSGKWWLIYADFSEKLWFRDDLFTPCDAIWKDWRYIHFSCWHFIWSFWRCSNIPASLFGKLIKKMSMVLLWIFLPFFSSDLHSYLLNWKGFVAPPFTMYNLLSWRWKESRLCTPQVVFILWLTHGHNM